jgi:hypothetical protein
MKFSEKIDNLLKDKGIKNLRKLAEEVDIPYTTLWDYYSNPIRLEKANLSYIKKIANHLGCTIDYLAYDDILDVNEIKLDGFDINENNDSEKKFNTKFKVKFQNQEEVDNFTDFMNNHNIKFQSENIIHSKEDTPPTSKTEILFNKTKDILNDDERAMIEATMERAIKKYEEEKNKRN